MEKLTPEQNVSAAPKPTGIKIKPPVTTKRSLALSIIRNWFWQKTYLPDGIGKISAIWPVFVRM
jgi:hypothetical protein